MAIVLHTSKHLYYHSFIIRIEAQGDTTLSIPMHELRSNFLFASSQVIVGKKTLRDVLGTIPLGDTHPLYSELKEGFPAGFIISAIPYQQEAKAIRSFCLECKKKTIVTINLIIIGERIKYFPEFVEAIKLMIDRGFGHPIITYKLLDIIERHPQKSELLLNRTGEIRLQPSMPIRFIDFAKYQYSIHQITINIETPTLIFKTEDIDLKKGLPGINEQNNGMFSIYHLIRSATERSLKLSVLYCGASVEDYLSDKNGLIEYLQQASTLKLVSCNLMNIQLPDIKQKGRKDRVPLEGMLGTMVFAGLFNCYVPLLTLFQDLRVGKNIAYGLGKYSIC